jgi:hypothetical protein
MSDRPTSAARAIALTCATSVLAIAAAAGIYLRVRPERSEAQPSAAVQTAGTQLIEGRDYRVMIAVARVRPDRPDGAKWDSGASGRAAPDPFYEIWWRGNRVHKSHDVKNVLVAAWSSMALPELHRLLTGQKISLETIQEGALITARAGDTIRFAVVDDDPIDNDLIEEFTVAIEELRVGDQVRPGRQGLEDVTVRVIPRDAAQLEHLFQ